jgi:outer membrane lipoprotein carrier protein
MKRLLLFPVFLFLVLTSWCQDNQVAQDPAAKVVLDRVALKTKSMRSIQADFELVIEDRKEKKKNSSTGNLVMKQNKYKLTGDGSVVFFNGTIMYTYLSANNEVTITEPDDQAGDFMSSPTTFFSNYNRDFKYRYVRETTINGSRCHEIDLFPKNLNQPYSRIKVIIGVTSDLPEIITSVGKDGIDYTVYLRNVVLDRDIADATFTFDPAKYKKVEIVDMRGMK